MQRNLLNLKPLLTSSNDLFKIQYANKSVLGQAILFTTSHIGIRIYREIKKLKKQLQKNDTPKVVRQDPKDVVILYQFPRTFNAPSLSPFAVKLETWLRMADIKYENRLYGQKSSQNLIPWIKLNNQIIEDSQLCVEYLIKVFNKDLDTHLTPEQKGYSRAILKMNEESLKWCLAYHRFWLSKNKNETNLPAIAYWLMNFKVYLASYFQGYGKFSSETFYEIGRKDLKALNDIIGNKKYVLSNDKPSNIDASVFGICVQFIYRDLGPLHQFVITECPNILRYVQHMKDEYWKDWESNVLHQKQQQKKNLFRRLFTKSWSK